MPHTNAPAVPTSASQPAPFSLDDLERKVTRSKVLAWVLIAGLPILGMVASCFLALPLFASLMAGCFLLAVSSVCYKALATFTGKTLRLLVAARLVVILVVGALLFFTGGGAWMCLVSATLLWLTADRLLGRRALYDLWKLTRARR